MSKTKTFVGYKPFLWQSVVHKSIQKYGFNSGHIFVVKAKRQIGKSFIIINELLRFSINKQGSVNGCLSPTLQQARKIYKEILKACENTGVIKKKNDSLLEIEFINCSSITFKSAEQRDNLRGYTFSGILCVDEAAYISDDIFSIIKPATDVWKCPILMVSTPRFKTGFFFDYYCFGQMDKYKDSISSFDLCKYDTSALLSKETLEMYRTMLPKNQFITEYLGDFLDDADGIVFSDFKDCIIKNKIEEDYNDIYIGIDWSAGVMKDETVLSALNERGEQVFLLHFNNKKATEQIDYIFEYLKPYLPKIRLILAENNGLGRPMCDNLSKRFSEIDMIIIIEQFITTNASKTGLVNQLQVAFEQKKIRILDVEQQIAQLSMYEAKINPKSGYICFNAPTGANDDMVIALMLSYEALKRGNKTGKYYISFI